GRNLGVGLEASFGALLQKPVYALFQRCEIVRDVPAHFLATRDELDPADEIRRGFELDVDIRGKRFVERILDCRALSRGQLERAAEERGVGRTFEGFGE